MDLMAMAAVEEEAILETANLKPQAPKPAKRLSTNNQQAVVAETRNPSLYL